MNLPKELHEHSQVCLRLFRPQVHSKVVFLTMVLANLLVGLICTPSCSKRQTSRVDLLCRELGSAISTVSADKIRPLELRDFTDAARRSKPSVNRQQLGVFEQWTQEFGTTA